MTEEQFKNLDAGDIVVGSSGTVYTVIQNLGHEVIAVKIAHMTNSSEWTLVSKVEQRATYYMESERERI